MPLFNVEISETVQDRLQSSNSR